MSFSNDFPETQTFAPTVPHHPSPLMIPVTNRDSEHVTEYSGAVKYNLRSSASSNALSWEAYEESCPNPPVHVSVSKVAGNGNTLPLHPIETYGTLGYADVSGSPWFQSIQIDLLGIINKNIFYNGGVWTCYRRNYMSCTCSYSLNPLVPNTRIQYLPQAEDQPQNVFEFAVGISAVTADKEQSTTELALYSAKRDKGPTFSPAKMVLAPQGLPNQDSTISLPGQDLYHPYPSSTDVRQEQVLPAQHTYERIMFRTSTRNRGKRQQFFQFVVELWANIGDQHPERWVRVATRNSHKLIVRGRSPGHYRQNKVQRTLKDPQIAPFASAVFGQDSVGVETREKDANTGYDLRLHSYKDEMGGVGPQPSVSTGFPRHRILETFKPYHYKAFDALLHVASFDEAGFVHHNQHYQSGQNEYPH